MASLNKRQLGTEPRESARGLADDSDRIVALDSGVPGLSATRSADPDEVEGLREEIDRLELLRRHLLKDIVVKDAYLAALRADRRAKESEISALHAEISALHESIAGLHGSIAQTLSQPRYRAVDALNAALHRVTFLHVLLKRWLVGQGGLDPPSSKSSP